jgi:hypothetical protein
MLTTVAQSDIPFAAEHGLPPLLRSFDPITLSEMADVALLDRMELKYIMPQRTLARVLSSLSADYRVLAIAGRRLSHYRTLYFDTADFALYRRHHAGAPERYKVRAREYVDSQAAFFEVKHKTKSRHTVKSRIPTVGLVTTLGGQAADFLEDACPYAADELAARLWNQYTRITLVSKTRPERVTLDLDLSFSWDGESVELPGLVVAEVKYQGTGYSSDFVRRMRELHVRGTSFSKYCIGISLLYPQEKHNRFKAKHQLIARLMEGERNELP